MSDLISRRDAMMEARPEYLNPNQKGHEEYNKAWNDGIKAYWNGLKELPSELEWIPCSERLPEVSGLYLVTTNAYGVWAARTDSYSVRNKDWKRKGDKKAVITAWMPLPEPYEAS